LCINLGFRNRGRRGVLGEGTQFGQVTEILQNRGRHALPHAPAQIPAGGIPRTALIELKLSRPARLKFLALDISGYSGDLVSRLATMGEKMASPESDQFSQLSFTDRLRKLMPAVMAILFMLVGTLYWTLTTIQKDKALITELRSRVEDASDNVADLKSIIEELKTMSSRGTSIAPQDLSSKLGEMERIEMRLDRSLGRIKQLSGATTASISIFNMLINQAYAQSVKDKPDDTSTSTQVRTMVMFVVLGVIVLSTILCFGILFFSKDADTLDYAKDALKAAGGFYFGLMNGLLGSRLWPWASRAASQAGVLPRPLQCSPDGS